LLSTARATAIFIFITVELLNAVLYLGLRKSKLNVANIHSNRKPALLCLQGRHAVTHAFALCLWPRFLEIGSSAERHVEILLAGKF
jgi:hypothetical protein